MCIRERNEVAVRRELHIVGCNLLCACNVINVILQRQGGLTIIFSSDILFHMDKIPHQIENINVLIQKIFPPPKNDHGAQRAIGI